MDLAATDGGASDGDESLSLPLPDGGHRVEIKMTLTAPGCGMGPILQQDVEGKVLALPGVKEAGVFLVWDPPWNREMLSEAAKLQLGMM